MKSRWLSILLLGLIAYQSFGYFVAFVVRLELHQAAMHEALEEHGEAESLQRIQFCLDDAASKGIHWVNDEEFWLNDALYDLQSATVSAEGEVTLIAFRDDVEFEQLADLQDVWESEEEEERNQPQQGLKFVEYQVPTDLPSLAAAIGKPISPDPSWAWNAEQVDRPSPPPQWS